MTAQEFIFKTAPFKKIEGDEYKELYKELSNDNLSVSGYNPIYNVETTKDRGDRSASRGGMRMQVELLKVA